MIKFQIWSSGYLCTGMEGIPAKAQLMAEAEGEDFVDACNRHFNGNKYYILSKGKPYYWACSLHDNETDARKDFG